MFHPDFSFHVSTKFSGVVVVLMKLSNKIFNCKSINKLGPQVDEEPSDLLE